MDSFVLGLLATTYRLHEQAHLGESSHGVDLSLSQNYTDPHFRTWDSIYYDYHGACDMYLVRNSILDIQIRTVEAQGYSYVNNVAVDLFGEAVFQLEVTPTIGGGNQLKIYKDGDFKTALAIPRSGTATGPLASVGSSLLQAIDGGHYELTLPNAQYVRFYVYGNSLAIDVKGNDDFVDSTGMLGKWDSPGALYWRDGTVVPGGTDPQLVAQDWRVGAQAGDVPLLPGGSGACTAGNSGFFPCLCGDGCFCGGEPDGRRHLRFLEDTICGGECVTEDQAQDVCQGIEPRGAQRNCEFDVKVTGDFSWPTAPFYNEPAPATHDARCISDPCDAKGGTCVLNQCTPNSEFICDPSLCSFAGVDGSSCVCRLPRNKNGGTGGDPVRFFSYAIALHICRFIWFSNPVILCSTFNAGHRSETHSMGNVTWSYYTATDSTWRRGLTFMFVQQLTHTTRTLNQPSCASVIMFLRSKATSSS